MRLPIWRMILIILPGLLTSGLSDSVYAEETAVTLEKGQRAPFDGVLLTNADLALLEKELQAFEEMNEALKGDLEKLKAQYSDELDKAYKTFDANSDAILKQIEAIDNTPIIIDETAWWEPVAWVVTGAAIVGVIWVVDSAL